MIYFVGVIVVLVGCYMCFDLFRRSQQPKLEARVLEVSKKHYYSKGRQSPRKMNHAKISFLLNNQETQTEIVVNNKLVIDEKILVTIQSNDITSVKHYTPKKELLSALALIALGAVIIWGCHLLINYLD